jgi:hypothetical protein
MADLNMLNFSAKNFCFHGIMRIFEHLPNYSNLCHKIQLV